MKKFFIGIFRVLQSIIVFPFCLLCGLSIGILYTIGLILCVPCWVIAEIWGYTDNE